MCTLCHEFGGLPIPHFLADAPLLEILHMVFMLESGRAVNAANPMRALRWGY
jgi:hypothetical protein